MMIFSSGQCVPLRYAAVESQMNRRLIEMKASLLLSVWLLVGLLALPCGAQAPPQTPTPPAVQNQAGQTPQTAVPSATPGAGVSTAGPTSVPASGVGSSASSSLGKRFGSAGQGLPGMPGGPPMKGSMGSQDPSGKYMTPPTIPPLLCDPAVNIPC
ncbi:MAG: hypothetical protein Q8L77_05235 [Nitrospirota bacterium]|nr:hypothetical protein [Nitrospirota bacterium]